MQLTTLLTILLSAGALPSTLALPTNTSSALLDKRANFGWIAAYGATDYTCKNAQVGPRPKVNKENNCVKFSPATDNVGINWGQWPNGFGSLAIYTDTKCKVPAGKNIMRPIFDSKEGPGSCVSVRRNGAMWGSVRNADILTGY